MNNVIDNINMYRVEFRRDVPEKKRGRLERGKAVMTNNSTVQLALMIFGVIIFCFLIFLFSSPVIKAF